MNRLVSRRERRVSGNDDDTRRSQRPIRFDLPAHLKPVETRHREIEQQDVRTKRAHFQETGIPVERGLESGSRAERAEVVEHRLDEITVVIDDEDAQPVAGSGGESIGDPEAPELVGWDPEVTAGRSCGP